MRKHIQTLRFKLAALSLVVFGVIQTALCVGILLAREKTLRSDFDRALIDRAEAIVEALHAGSSSGISADVGPLAFLNSGRYADYYVQIEKPDGTFIHHSPNLGSVRLPWRPPAADISPAEPYLLETISDTAATNLIGGGGQMRLLTFYDLQTAPPPRVQVGRNLAVLGDRIASLQRIVMVAIPVGLLVSGLASWFVAKRSLSPIAKIVRQARELQPAELHRRIDAPIALDEVGELVVVINQMLDRIEKGFRAQEQFIADVSHELKTPLAVLLGEAQVLMQRERPVEEYRRFVSSAQEELHRLTRIVHSLLMVARADAGLALPDAVEISVNEVVTDAARRCDQAGRDRRVRLVVQIAMPRGEESAPVVMGDADLLGAVIENLIRNAVRFSPVDERVEVTVHGDERHVTVSVRDRGPGIASEHLENVFGRFFHLPGGDPRVHSTGLGLAIARGVVELHHGTIQAGSPEGGGCEMLVQLPRVTPAARVKIA